MSCRGLFLAWQYCNPYCLLGLKVPQYLLDEGILKGRGAATSVVCTQPRRVAAISVSERVAAERGGPPPGAPGGLIGYHVRLDAAATRDTRLLFCTTGILLRRLASEPYLDSISHVIVDEVHLMGWFIGIGGHTQPCLQIHVPPVDNSDNV